MLSRIHSNTNTQISDDENGRKEHRTLQNTIEQEKEDISHASLPSDSLEMIEKHLGTLWECLSCPFSLFIYISQSKRVYRVIHSILGSHRNLFSDTFLKNLTPSLQECVSWGNIFFIYTKFLSAFCFLVIHVPLIFRLDAAPKECCLVLFLKISCIPHL